MRSLAASRGLFQPLSPLPSRQSNHCRTICSMVLAYSLAGFRDDERRFFACIARNPLSEVSANTSSNGTSVSKSYCDYLCHA